MLRGLYTGWTGMVNEQKRLDVISNNLANADTLGYKQESVSSQSFDKLLTIKIRDGSQSYHNQAIGTMSLGVKVGEVYTDYSQGSIRGTSSPLDLALSGSGFFTITDILWIHRVTAYREAVEISRSIRMPKISRLITAAELPWMAK